MVRGKGSWIQDQILRVSSHPEEQEPHRLVDIIVAGAQYHCKRDPGSYEERFPVGVLQTE